MAENKPNFFAKNSVIIDKPVSTTLPILFTPDGLESVVRLSSMCTGFALLEQDFVSLPTRTRLSEAHVRKLAAAEDPNVPNAGERLLRRQFFTMEETVPVLFGMNTKVTLKGCMTWDEQALEGLYESETDTGIVIWKPRMVEAVQEDGREKTRITEHIEGSCPSWMRIIVQSTAKSSHKAHMEKYHTLF